MFISIWQWISRSFMVDVFCVEWERYCFCPFFQWCFIMIVSFLFIFWQSRHHAMRCVIHLNVQKKNWPKQKSIKVYKFCLCLHAVTVDVYVQVQTFLWRVTLEHISLHIIGTNIICLILSHQFLAHCIKYFLSLTNFRTCSFMTTRLWIVFDECF